MERPKYLGSTFFSPILLLFFLFIVLSIHETHNNLLHTLFHYTAYTVVEGRTVEVCLSPITEELEASITVKISVKDGSATEGTYSVYAVQFSLEL